MKTCRSLIASLLLMVIAISDSYSQSPYFHTSEIDILGKMDRVNCIEQRTDHFILIGTSAGLLRYDGIEFYKFKTSKTDHDFTAILEDKSGTVWTGTNNGMIMKLNGDSLISYSLFNSTGNTYPITQIIEDKKNTIWISTYGNGIFRIINDSIVHLNESSGLPDLYIYTLINSASGNLLAGSDVGIQIINLAEKDSYKIESVTSANGLPDNIVRTMAANEDGSVWIGTHSKGVTLFDPVTKTFSTPKIARNWNFGTITSILPLKEEVWIGTSRNGIINLGYGKEESLQNYNSINGLHDDRILHLFQDMEGNILIAGNSNKLGKTNKKFTFIDIHENVSFKNILAITGDSKGNIWFSNNSGLFKHNVVFNGNHEMEIPLRNSDHKKHTIISLIEDSEGFIWAGTFDNGALRIDPVTKDVLRFDITKGLTDNNVIAMAKQKNSIWLATLGGVAKLVPVGSGNYMVTNYGKHDGLGNNYVFDIYTDSKNRVWFATDGSGLSVYDGETFTNYSSQMDSLSQIVYSIVEDNNGNIWYSTPGNGLYWYDGNRFKRFQNKKNQGVRRSVGLALDHNGNIVSVSNAGIDIINTSTYQVTSYESAYGINNITPQIKAISIDSKGNIWIGGEENTIILERSDIGKTTQSQTRLLGISILLNPVELKDESKFSHKENHITFTYSGLWFQNPEAVHYRYMLEGFDRDWIYTRDRKVTFSFLPPGSYTFRVQSSHSSNFESATEDSVSFAIEAPFWSRSWFILAVVLLITSLLFYYIKRRERRLNKYERDQREKLSLQLETLRNQVNPHFLFNSFNTLLHLIEEDKNASVKYVENLAQFFRDILQYRDQNLIPLHEEIKLSDHYLYLQKQRYNSNLQIEFDVPEMYLNDRIPPLTLQILFENALKHNVATKSKPLHIKVFVNEGYLNISNNLQPKSSVGPSTKIGLENIRKRYSLLTDKPVRIDMTDHSFCAAVPLISEIK